MRPTMILTSIESLLKINEWLMHIISPLGSTDNPEGIFLRMYTLSVVPEGLILYIKHSFIFRIFFIMVRVKVNPEGMFPRVYFHLMPRIPRIHFELKNVLKINECMYRIRPSGSTGDPDPWVICCAWAVVAQILGFWVSEQKVRGSSPALPSCFCWACEPSP